MPGRTCVLGRAHIDLLDPAGNVPA